jgi:lipid II:glycine glycyltransferase (peptidoglycan interpeptide bridge formation enzyme)
MKFEILTNSDPDEWDQYVSSSPYGHFMQSYAWGTFQSSMGWEPHYLILRERETVCGAAMLLSRKLPIAGGKIFYAPRGPVVDFTNIEAVRALNSAIREYISQENGWFMRTDPYVQECAVKKDTLASSGLNKVVRDWSYWNAPKLVFWLDLQDEEDAIFKRMSSTCRNEVRKGYRNEVEFALGGEDDLVGFCRLMAVTGQYKGVAFHDLDYFQSLFATMNRAAMVQLFTGKYKGQIITAGISVKYGANAWLLYAASDPAHYKLRANRAQQWEMIKWARDQGCERYDFRGTATSDPPSPDDPGYGVYKFKKGFGPEYTRLVGYYDLVNRPALYRMFRFAEEKLLPTAYKLRTWLGERGK